MPKTEKLRYVLYARKSSESEDRQIQSIDDQVSYLTKLANAEGLQIVDVLTEAKSAKQPYGRVKFSEMMDRIEQGYYDGILSWKLDRLSRNSADSGRLQWLVQSGVIKVIRTAEREYTPQTSALLMSVETGMSTQFIQDLSRNTKRGLQSKVERGWAHYIVPIGYLNDKEDKTQIKDPDRFAIVRKIWDHMLTGTYSPPQILKMANNEWGLRTVKRKRSGGNPVSRSAIYKILNSIFYAGIIEYNGKQYPGKFPAMITMEEYDRVQFLLGKKGKSRPQKRHFAFTGMIRCGECGCIITAEIKKKHLKTTGEVREYTYYHCTLRKPQVKCSQRQVIREDELEKQIAEEIQQFTILPEFKDWALEVLREENTHEVDDRTTVYESQQKALNQAQGKLDRLVDMRLNELLTDEQYAEKKAELEAEIKQFKTQMRSTENRAENWLETTEKVFNFATHAHTAFVNGNLETKKQILLALGSNQTLKDGKLAIEASPWLVPIKKDYSALKEEFLRLEPADMPENKERMAHLRTIRTRWLRLLDDFRTACQRFARAA
jgi:DNA invertase Pin-like site-specific DNA recombinase